MLEELQGILGGFSPSKPPLVTPMVIIYNTTPINLHNVCDEIKIKTSIKEVKK
jgi:hypothetical protein